MKLERIALLTALLALPAALAQTVSSPIPIGAALAETSNVALLGQEEVVGVKLAQSYVNSHGGVDGTPIKVILEDTGGNVTGAINAFQLLMNKDHVVGIVGPTLSQQAFGADPIAVQAKVPVIGPSDTANGIPEIGPYVSRVSAPVSAYAPDALKAVLSFHKGITRVAQFYAENDAFSKSEAGTFRQAFKKVGLNLVDVEKTKTGQSNFTSQITTALAKHPQLIEISTLAADGANLVKQLRQFGYTGQIIGGNGLNTPAIFPVCQKYCGGIYIAEAYSPSLKNAVNSWLGQHYRAQYHAAVPQLTAQAFTGVLVFANALSRVAASAHQKIVGMNLAALRVKLNQAVQTTTNFVTPLGAISIYKVPNGGGELNQKDFYVAQIHMNSSGKSGSFVYVK